MKMKWFRDQLGVNGGLFTQKSFEGWLTHGQREFKDSVWRGLLLSFRTPSTGNSFDSTIGSEDFEALAREMMRADATAAVQAFGKVLQEVSSVPNFEEQPTAPSAAAV